MNGHICSQVVDIVVMDLVQKTAMCAVLRSQGLEVQSILMDHILCRRRFAVPAGVKVISIPIWNSFAFQSVVQEIPPFPPFPPRPSHDSHRKGRCLQPQLPISSLNPLRNEQIWLWAATMAYKYGVYLLPTQLDEKVAELHFPALGAALTVFAQEHPSSFLPDVVVFHEPVLLQLDLLTY